MKTQYNIGVEVEKLRCTADGKLSTNVHPKEFGDKMKNNFITTDFGEAQMELRTPVCSSIEECYSKLETITDVVLDVLNEKNELLWPYSMPCILPDEKDFPFNDYGKYIEEKEYEDALYKKYGYKMHCMSGVHVNFSINKDFFINIKDIYDDIPNTIDEAYLRIMRVFIDRAWMLIYLLGASPIEYETGKKCQFSIRNSNNTGFGNRNSLNLDLSSRENYAKSIYENLKNGNIISVREVYTPIRAKSKSKDNIIEDFKRDEINRIEIRLFDLNPFDKCGISKEDLQFIVAFLFYCLIEQSNFRLDYKYVAENGITEENRLILLKELEKILEINNKLNLNCYSGITKMQEICKTSETRAKKILSLVEENGLLSTMITLAKEYSREGEKNKYIIKGYSNLEASTVVLLKDAVLHGINFNIINEDTSFIELMDNFHVEYVVQATKTNRDSYIFPYITDDKFFSKKIMKENGLDVSNGMMINKNMRDEDITLLIEDFVNKSIVIKPRATNCGTGITIFHEPVQIELINNAIQYAFKYDNYVLVEDYVKGREYRFVVIDGKCESVIWRRSASIVGNGINTIQELIEMKNKEDWHLLLRHSIIIDDVVKKFLQFQGLSLESIPSKNERVFLRENSNCSTGGESVGMTDKMPDYFKHIAEQASKIFKANICGVDIIIDDLSKNDYKIIEINDNPGISSSEWTYEGKGINVGMKILELLGFKE